jgi:hypothetical protein
MSYENKDDVKKGLQKVKKAFKEVVLFYNKDGKALLDDEGKTAFKELYNIWFKIKNLDDKYEKVFEIKQYHNSINASNFDKNSDNLWINYISCCMSFRVKLLIFVQKLLSEQQTLNIVDNFVNL